MFNFDHDGSRVHQIIHDSVFTTLHRGSAQQSKFRQRFAMSK
jgi:hypothetical protein